MRERILTRSFELFRQFGIKSTSMDDIAHHMGTSKKTIYKWFENKDQIVKEGLNNYLEDLTAGCFTPQCNTVEDFYHAFDIVIQKLLTFNTSFFLDLKKYHYPAYDIWSNFREQHIIKLFKTNLENGIKSSLYRSDFNPEILARLYVGQLENIFNGELFPPEKFNRKEVYEQNLLHFISGLALHKNNTSLTH